MLRHSEQLDQLAKALSAAQGVMEGASKDKLNPHFKSKYADLASVWSAVREPLAKHGLSVVQLPFTDADGRVQVSTMLMHQSGQWIEASYYVTPTKNDAQGVGSAITYMKRFALTGMGVAPEDDDGEGAVARAHTNGNGLHSPLPQSEPAKRPVAAPPADEAKKWVGSASATVKAFDSATGLNAWMNRNQPALDRLKAVEPQLYTDVEHVIAEQYAKLSPLNA